MAGHSKILVIVGVILLGQVNAAARRFSPEEKAALTLYKNAKELSHQGKYRHALDLLEKAYLVLPNKYITYNLAQVYFKLGNCPSMHQYLDQLNMAELPPPVRKTAKQMRGICRVRTAVRLPLPENIHKLATLYTITRDDSVKNTIKKDILNILVSGAFGRLVKKNILLNNNMSALWKDATAVLGDQKVMGIHLRLLSEMSKAYYAGRDTQGLRIVLPALAGLLMKSGNTTLSCPWVQHSKSAKAACWMYSKGMEAFNNQDYATAKYGFGIAATFRQSAEVDVYLGMSLLYLGKREMGLRMLEAFPKQAARLGFGLVVEAMKRFHITNPKLAVEVGKALQECHAKHAGCTQILDGLVAASVLKPCEIYGYFKENPMVRTHFAAQCAPRQPIAVRQARPSAMTGPRRITVPLPRPPAPTPKPAAAKPVVQSPQPGLTKKTPARPKPRAVPAARPSIPWNVVTYRQKTLTLRAWAYTTLGLSVVLIGTGAYLWGTANSVLGHLLGHPENYSQKDFKAKVGTAYTKQHWGVALTSLGIASAAASAVLFIIEPKHSVHVNAFVTPNMTGIGAFTEF